MSLAEIIAPPNPAENSARRYIYRIDDYERMWQAGLFEGKNVQLLQGEVVEMPPISCPHSTSVGKTARTLERAYGPGFHSRQEQPLIIPDRSMPQPDVALVTGELDDYSCCHPVKAVLIVEICVSTDDIDRGVKPGLYAATGTPSYWIVYPEKRQVLVFVGPIRDGWVNGGMAFESVRVYGAADRIPLIGALVSDIAVADLLPTVPA